MMTYEKLKEMLSRAPETAITVVGDFCLDKYLYIDPARDEPSLETGLTAYQVTHKGIYPGGAGSVTNNLRALTAKVYTVGVIGEDGEGYELCRELNRRGADTSYMITDTERCTSTYTKPMRGKDGGYTEMSRLDFKNFKPMREEITQKVISNLRETVKLSRAVLVLDQFVEEDCGVINRTVREELVEIAKENPDLIIYGDSRAYIHLFRSIIVKCNNFEVVKSVRPDYPAGQKPDLDLVRECGSILYQKNQKPVFVTLGPRGIYAFDKDGAHLVDAVDVPGPFDHCGAGDAASSGIVTCMALGGSPEDAALWGNIVSSITIQQIGVTGTASPQQVLDRYEWAFGK